jgi:LytS/YehU family sensor histidine kinase
MHQRGEQHSYFVVLTFTFVFWEGMYQFTQWASRRYPSYTQTMKRIAVQVVFMVVYVFVANVAVRYLLLDQLLGFWEFHAANLTQYYWRSLGITTVVASVYESVYFFQEWKRKIQETERQQKELAHAQFEALRNQVNPHFLFNSLNTLAYLIEFESDRALAFVQKLSQVYRYVLQQRERSMVTLQEELEVLEAYFYLLQMRYEDNLQVEMKLPEHPEAYTLPPLSLQLLIENAVKHNVINKRHPMRLALVYEPVREVLRVENTLQRKTSVASNGVGLVNLESRMRELTDRPLEIHETADCFVVELPITPAYAYADR